jgi:glyoxylase-like metal-dependent hydrolase (beta-lactamase superfamily II)
MARPPGHLDPPPALRHQVGDIELLVLSDGLLRSPIARMGDARSAESVAPLASTAGDDAIWLGLNCVVVRTPSQLILVDTGFGDGPLADDPDLVRSDTGLFDALQRHGIDPADVSRVVNTHLHTDHCGGNLTWVQELARPTFPNADYIVQRAEYAWALAPDPASAALYAPDEVRLLTASGQLGILDGDRTIAAGVSVRQAVGHTPGHQIVLVESRGQAAAVTGDLAPMRIHVENPRWQLRGDAAPRDAVDSRLAVLRWAREARASVIPYHEPGPPWVEVRELP